MILNNKGKYAVTAILDLCHLEGGLQNKARTVKLDDIARKHTLPLPYLEQIFANLRKSGIVKSKKGPGGGYFLAKEPGQISISQVIAATGENLRMTSCTRPDEGCNLGQKANNIKCKTHKLWFGLESKITDYLDSVSIADVYNNNFG